MVANGEQDKTLKTIKVKPEVYKIIYRLKALAIWRQSGGERINSLSFSDVLGPVCAEALEKMEAAKR